jgi:exopolysaccharide biosynthesis polyprenyl glycosylphosphotransferase
MKRAELIFGAILLPVDYLMLVLAGISAYFLRFGETISGIKPVVYEMPLRDYIIVILITSVILLIIFGLEGLYNLSGTRRIVTEFKKIFLACTTGVMIVVILVFFNRELFSSRFIILAAWLFSLIYIASARYLIIQIQRYFLIKGYGLHRVVLIGNNNTTKILKAILKKSQNLGYEIIEECPTIDGHILEKLEKIIRLKPIDEIINMQPDLSSAERNQLIDFCNEHHLVFKYAADLFAARASNVEIRPIAGIPIIEVKKTPLDGWGKIFKRVFDFIFSLFFLLLTWWLMLLVAIAIKLDSKGPVIYKNERIGINGKKFKVYKFRSMRTDYCVGEEYGDLDKNLEFEEKLIQERSIKAGPVYKIKDDPRVTKVGKFIRRTSLDEFPQVFNTIIGDMSWVGPRPHQPREVAKYEKQHKEILNINPGITGLAQISGRSDLAFIEEVRLDTYYMENWSWWLDLYIIVKSPFVLLKRRKAL